jgi:hypothetical protein
MSESAKKEVLSRFLADEITKNVQKPGFILDGVFNVDHITEFEKEVQFCLIVSFSFQKG